MYAPDPKYEAKRVPFYCYEDLQSYHAHSHESHKLVLAKLVPLGCIQKRSLEAGKDQGSKQTTNYVLSWNIATKPHSLWICYTYYTEDVKGYRRRHQLGKPTFTTKLMTWSMDPRQVRLISRPILGPTSALLKRSHIETSPLASIGVITLMTMSSRRRYHWPNLYPIATPLAKAKKSILATSASIAPSILPYGPQISMSGMEPSASNVTRGTNVSRLFASVYNSRRSAAS